jgi:predicted GTPase
LLRDLGKLGRADVIATEIKAAAIDVVAAEAEKRGLDLVFVDNEPVEVAPGRPGELREEASRLGRLAKERFEAQV